MMGGYPSQLPGMAGLWGGQGFGGLGSPGAVPPQPNLAALAGGPTNLSNVVPPPSVIGPGTGNMASWWGGRGVGGPGQQLGTIPGASFTNPAQGQDLWSRLMNAVGTPQAGQFRMPGTTIGAPAGQTPPPLAAAPAMMPQGQMPMPPGAALPSPAAVPLGSYFRQQQFPNSNNNALMSQYMALQQLMRGS